jgi:hypothetical protein
MYLPSLPRRITGFLLRRGFLKKTIHFTVSGSGIIWIFAKNTAMGSNLRLTLLADNVLLDYSYAFL